MANRFLITAPSTYTDPTDDLWHSLSNQAAGDEGGFAEGEDVAVLDDHSGNFTLGVNMACAGFTMPGYTNTFALAEHDLDVGAGAACTLAGTITGTGNMAVAISITLALGTDTSGWSGVLTHDAAANNHTLTTNGVTIPNLTINNDGVDSFTLEDNLIVGPLTYTAGKFTTTGRTITIRAGTHDLSWPPSDYALTHLIIPDGAKANLAGHVYVGEITFGAGVGGVSLTTDAARSLQCWFTSNDRWHQAIGDGTISPAIIEIRAVGAIEIGYLDGSQVATRVDLFAQGGSRTITMTDDWTIGTKPLNFTTNAAGTALTLDTNGHNLTGAAVTLGKAAVQNSSGILDLSSGTHTIAGPIASGDDANENNALDFATCTITVTEDIDLDNVAVTANEATLEGEVTLTNFNCNGVLYAYDATDGGDNGDVRFTACMRNHSNMGGARQGSQYRAA